MQNTITIPAREVVPGMLLDGYVVEHIEPTPNLRMVVARTAECLHGWMADRPVVITLPGPGPRELLCSCHCQFCAAKPVCRGRDYADDDEVEHLACDECCGHCPDSGRCAEWLRLAEPHEHSADCPVRRLRLRVWPAPVDGVPWTWAKHHDDGRHVSMPDAVRLSIHREGWSNDGARMFATPSLLLSLLADEKAPEHTYFCLPAEH